MESVCRSLVSVRETKLLPVAVRGHLSSTFGAGSPSSASSSSFSRSSPTSTSRVTLRHGNFPRTMAGNRPGCLWSATSSAASCLSSSRLCFHVCWARTRCTRVWTSLRSQQLRFSASSPPSRSKVTCMVARLVRWFHFEAQRLQKEAGREGGRGSCALRLE